MKKLLIISKQFPRRHPLLDAVAPAVCSKPAPRGRGGFGYRSICCIAASPDTSPRGIMMVHRLSKVDAAKVLQIHHSTIDRMIQRGELQVEREGHGSKSKVWVLLDDALKGPSGDTSTASASSPDSSPRGSSSTPDDQPGDVSAELELATLRERVQLLEQLMENQRQQLVDADWRYQQLLEQLSASQRISENLTRSLSLPAPEVVDDKPAQHRRWWPFGNGKPTGPPAG